MNKTEITIFSMILTLCISTLSAFGEGVHITNDTQEDTQLCLEYVTCAHPFNQRVKVYDLSKGTQLTVHDHEWLPPFPWKTKRTQKYLSVPGYKRLKIQTGDRIVTSQLYQELNAYAPKGYFTILNDTEETLSFIYTSGIGGFFRVTLAPGKSRMIKYIEGKNDNKMRIDRVDCGYHRVNEIHSYKASKLFEVPRGYFRIINDKKVPLCFQYCYLTWGRKVNEISLTLEPGEAKIIEKQGNYKESNFLKLNQENCGYHIVFSKQEYTATELTLVPKEYFKMVNNTQEDVKITYSYTCNRGYTEEIDLKPSQTTSIRIKGDSSKLKIKGAIRQDVSGGETWKVTELKTYREDS